MSCPEGVSMGDNARQMIRPKDKGGMQSMESAKCIGVHGSSRVDR